jgi:hypothetical protein
MNLWTAPTQDQITARLAAHRCVWCSDDLELLGSPDDMFCNDGCQHAWHDWSNHTPRTATPANETGANPADEPTHEPAIHVPASIAYRLGYPRADLNYSERAEHDDRAVRTREAEEADHFNTTPVPFTPPQRVASLDTTLSRPVVFHPAMTTTTEPPVEGDTYPHRQVAKFTTQGWLIPTRGYMLQPVRTCATCGVDTLTRETWVSYPSAAIASFGVRAAGQPIVATAQPIPVRLAVVCERCRSEHPGRTIACMVRPFAPQSESWELACLTRTGYTHYVLTPEILTRMPERITSQVWANLHHRAIKRDGPICDVPACFTPVGQWLALGGVLTYGGYQWTPTSRPLAVGLCHTHLHDMTGQLYRDPDMATRAHMRTTARDTTLFE